MSAATEAALRRRVSELESEVDRLRTERERAELVGEYTQQLREQAFPPPQEIAAFIEARYDTTGAPGRVRQRLSVWRSGKEAPRLGTVERMIRDDLNGDPSDFRALTEAAV